MVDCSQDFQSNCSLKSGKVKVKKHIPRGALPDHVLSSMVASGEILGVTPEHVNPASINLPISEEVWRIERFVLPQSGEKIRDLIRSTYLGRPHTLSHPLEVGVSYLVRLKSRVLTDKKIYGFFNPRSTTGRTFLNIRVVVDGAMRYDSLPSESDGEMWLLVKNDIFSCLLQEDDELVQLRLFHSDSRLDEKSLRALYKKTPLLFSRDNVPYLYDDLKLRDNDGSLVMTASIPIGEIGWRTKITSKPVKFSKINQLTDFFERAYSSDKTFTLDNRTGLIIPTKELVRVPKNMAAECVRVDDRAGDHSSHRAGYVDAGWFGAITLEITGSNETICDGTSVVKLKYEWLDSEAQEPYKGRYSGKSVALLGRNFK